jgi:hypothetical protein
VIKISHRQIFWPGNLICYSIDRENIERCIIYKCPNFNFGSCVKSRCTLIKK